MSHPPRPLRQFLESVVCPVVCPSGVSAASGLLGKPGTYQKSPGSWDLRYPYQKLKSLRIWPTIFRELPNFVYEKSNIERERVNVRSEPDFYWGNVSSEPDFYWGNSKVNFKGQNPGGESFPTFPSGGYAHGTPCVTPERDSRGYWTQQHVAQFLYLKSS